MVVGVCRPFMPCRLVVWPAVRCCVRPAVIAWFCRSCRALICAVVRVRGVGACRCCLSAAALCPLCLAVFGLFLVAGGVYCCCDVGGFVLFLPAVVFACLSGSYADKYT